MKVILIPNWDTLQHYKTRGAPWCKSYRNTLDQPGYRRLPFAARGLLADLWRLAIETTNCTPYSAEWLAFRLSGDANEITVLVELLATTQAITLAEQSGAVASMDASAALLSRSTSLSPSASEREEKRENGFASRNGDGETERRRGAFRKAFGA